MKVTLYQPDIAGNLGSIMRSCACFGVQLSVIEPCGFPLSAKALRRSAMDYGVPQTLTRYSSWDAFQAGRAEPLVSIDKHQTAGNSPNNGRLVLFTTKGATPLPDFTFKPSDTLLFGRESAGVPETVHDAADARVIIPIVKTARSFNLANSAAIALYEALRQTGQLPR